MAELSTTTAKAKTKPTASLSGPHFETAFSSVTVEAPAALREFAEKGLSQAKDGYEKMKSAAEEASNLLETSCNSAAKGATDYGLRLIEASRANTNAAFDFYSELMNVKSYSDMIELSTAHARKQFEAVTAQTKELAALAQKMATETAEPIKDSVSKVFSKVA